MVSIQSSYTVTPSEPTPIRKLFSLCEQIKLRTHAPLLFVYKPNTSPSLSSQPSSSPPSSSSPPPSSSPLKSSNLVVNTLRDSLSKALSIYYPLAGRLSWIEGSRLWELNCNAKGALLLEARCETACLADLGDFVPTNLVSKLIPNIDYGCPIDETPLLAVQLTRFPCGSFTIGVALCRASIDGTGTMMFLKAWAKLARGDGLDLKTDFPNHDRSLLDSRRLNCSKKTMQSRSEFCAPPPWLGRLEEGENRVVVEIVKLNGEQVKKLRMKAVINSNDSSNRRYSTFEVIAGHLWRCASKARYEPGNGDQPTRLSTLVNVRNRLNPPLPSSFSGNAAFPTVTTPTCTFNDLIQNPLSFAAKKVKRSIETVNDEYVRSCLDYIATERNKIDSVRYNFHYPAKSVIGDDDDDGGGLKGKNPNLFVVSWMNFSFKDVDFGLGETVYFGPGFMDSEGKAFVMNNANGDGLIVAICLSASHMDRFRRFFYEDVEEVVPSSKL